MIVATAGHVDHGKTSLVRALTGIDTDRLAEEKARGLTIDLGFAYQARPGGTLGFVDVPGHERFVRTMIAGVACIDHALVVVAADDGVMPQTAEHVAVLDLLGVAGATVALTKADRVGPERLGEVAREAAGLLEGTGLAGAPVIAVSARTGAGIAELRARLDSLLAAPEEQAPRDRNAAFRLAVDRVFALPGVGLVATGAVLGGEVRIGDRVVASPAGLELRVRGLHAEGAPAEIGRAGQRCALNLAGRQADRAGLGRGSWIVDPGLHAPTRRLDARVRVLAGAGGTLRDRTPVHVHLGAADVPGRIAVLGGRAIGAGEEGLAQLVLERDVAAAFADRFVLRDQSARRTLGGGRVIDPFAPARGRGRPQRLAELAAGDAGDPAAALAGLAAAAPHGVDLGRFAVARALKDGALAEIVDRLGLRAVGSGAARLGLAPSRWARLEERALARLGAPGAGESAGVGVGALARAIGAPDGLAAAVLAALKERGLAETGGGKARLKGARPGLGPADGALWDKVRAELAAHALRPPSVAVLAEAVGGKAKGVEAMLGRAQALGLVFRIARNRFILAETLRALAEIAEALAAEGDGTFTAAAFRDRAGIGRNVSIEVIELFDRMRFTRRKGEARAILTPLGAVKWGGDG